jgi:hypothetical protein
MRWKLWVIFLIEIFLVSSITATYVVTMTKAEACSIASGFSCYGSSVLAAPASSVTITYPYNETTVLPVVNVVGSSQSIPAGYSVWIVVYVPIVAFGHQFFPMSDAVQVYADGSWNYTTYLGGENDAGNRFDIIAVMADQTAQETIGAYNVNLTAYNTPSLNSTVLGFKPGMATLPSGAVEYCRVTLKRGAWSGFADLRCNPSSITKEGNAGTSIDFYVTLENKGTVNASNINVLIRGEVEKWASILTQSIQVIPSSQNGQVTGKITIPQGSTGTHNGSLVIEGNNFNPIEIPLEVTVTTVPPSLPWGSIITAAATIIAAIIGAVAIWRWRSRGEGARE